jgi:flagellar basal body-associated protein FliL
VDAIKLMIVVYMAVTVYGGFFFFFFFSKCSDKEIVEMKAANNTREKKLTFGSLQPVFCYGV